MDEIWKPVVGFEGLYSVSNYGRVRREAGVNFNGRNYRERVLRPHDNKYGYVKYTLYKEAKPYYKVGHRLVCEAFHGPAPSGKSLVLHRDDDPQNNWEGNLYWGSNSDNQEDIKRNGNNYAANKTDCVNGHPYTPDNTYINPKTGSRSCKKCRYQHTKNFQMSKRRKND